MVQLVKHICSKRASFFSEQFCVIHIFFNFCRTFRKKLAQMVSDSESHLQGLVRLGHGEDFVSGVDAAQFAEWAEQPLTRPAVELQLLLVMLRTGQNLRTRAKSLSGQIVFQGTFYQRNRGLPGCVYMKRELLHQPELNKLWCIQRPNLKQQ